MHGFDCPYMNSFIFRLGIKQMQRKIIDFSSILSF